MRPVKVSMTAFGPYKDCETINFEHLQEHRLFVISGNTGAGKTTIFDAICFALYGEANGEERNDTKLLRSHFAEDEAYTSVEFTFDLNGTRYRVFRQMGHIKENNKTATGGQVELFEVRSDQEVPCVDRFTISDVNEKLEKLIGLTKDQFSQIVMIPQGEFRKLLTSETENKEEILRRIFKTHSYDLVRALLDDKRKVKKELVEKGTATRDAFVNSIKTNLPEREGSKIVTVLGEEYFNIAQVLEGLHDELEFYNLDREQKQSELEQAVKQVDQKTEHYHQAQDLATRFKELEEKQVAHVALSEQLSSIKSLEEKLKQAGKASRIHPYEEHVLDLQKALEHKREQHEQLTKYVDEISRGYQEAAATYEKESNRSTERDELKTEVQRLKEMIPVVQELALKEKEISTIKQKIEKGKQEISKLNKEVATLRLQKENVAKSIKIKEEETKDLADKMEQYNQIIPKGQALRRFTKQLNDLEVRKKQKMELNTKLDLVKKSYNELEHLWIEGQASFLAAHLHDGESCPVCGSKEHPNKTEVADELPSREQLATKRQEKEGIEKEYQSLVAQCRSLETSIEESIAELEDYNINHDQAVSSLKKLEQEAVTRKNELNYLKDQSKRLYQEREQLDKISIDIDEKINQKDQISNELNKFTVSFEKLQTLKEEQVKSISDDLRTPKALEEVYRTQVAHKEQLENQWEKAQKNYQRLKGELIKEKTNFENIESGLKEAEQKKQEARSKFEEQVSKADFASIEAYKLAKMTEAKQEEYKHKVDSYYTRKVAIETQITEFQKYLKDKSKPNLETLKAELEEFKTARDKVNKSYQLAERYLEEVQKLMKSIEYSHAKVKDLEKEYEVITDIYDVVRGNNELKISFERYLQIEFLEQIILAANERLRNLSNGQYYLKRSDRLEKRGRQSGLGLDVYDSYTGQTRDVKSLSGGEKFNASLCLALGMADVIQAFEGGISIETMFIDEGFGSLDEESLTKAIDTLIDLQQAGRMIGVISHVQELKNAIPAVLEVKKTREGYSRTKFLIQ